MTRRAGDERAVVQVPPIVRIVPVRVSPALAVIAPQFGRVQVAVRITPRRAPMCHGPSGSLPLDISCGCISCGSI